MLQGTPAQSESTNAMAARHTEKSTDVYFSADVETDGPIPGPFSMLSFALVYAGTFDGSEFERPSTYDKVFYRELKPISTDSEVEALRVNGLDRDRLVREGCAPEQAMVEASEWVSSMVGAGQPALVAYPLSFDWTWLYWYFIRFCPSGSPFGYSRCSLRPSHPHTHHAVDDAVEQAEIFANVFEWHGKNGFDL